jgi:hypothetical protein
MSEERDDQGRPCLHCMMIEVIDDYFAEYSATTGEPDTIDTDEVVYAPSRHRDSERAACSMTRSARRRFPMSHELSATSDVTCEHLVDRMRVSRTQQTLWQIPLLSTERRIRDTTHFGTLKTLAQKKTATDKSRFTEVLRT